MKKCVAVVVLLSLLSLGRSAPLSSCDHLVKPITVSNEDMLGRWLYIGGSSDLPGSRSLGHLMTSIWLDITATTQSNILNIIQTQKVYGKCSSLTYTVTFENSTMLIEQPFYLKEVYLTTNCSDCLVVHEELTSGKDTFTSFMLFSRRQSVSPDVVEAFKTQAECLKMLSPIMINTNNEICPDNISPSDGLSALNSLLEAKMGHRVAKLLDAFFDMFVN
ncbi:lipocalin-like [Sebastes fasciatus]|uniref:lipocalin-like n=1 Tax=Sebastes fasciatus TaxID=394691 RepID=UPI003D9F2D77